MPIAGAPRTTMSRMAAATLFCVMQRQIALLRRQSSLIQQHARIVAPVGRDDRLPGVLSPRCLPSLAPVRCHFPVFAGDACGPARIQCAQPPKDAPQAATKHGESRHPDQRPLGHPGDAGLRAAPGSQHRRPSRADRGAAARRGGGGPLRGQGDPRAAGSRPAAGFRQQPHAQPDEPAARTGRRPAPDGMAEASISGRSSSAGSDPNSSPTAASWRSPRCCAGAPPASTTCISSPT